MTLSPYYKDDLVTLYHGDLFDVLPQLIDVFDACITDPPYGKTSLAWDRWPGGWPQLVTTFAPQLWCFGSMKMFFEKIGEFASWRFAQEIVWEKHNGSSSHADRFRRIHEFACHFYQGEWKGLYTEPQYTNDATKRRIHRKKRPVHWNDIGSHHFEAQEGGPRLMTSVIYARSCHGKAVNETQKPEEIIAPLVGYSVPPRGLVLDCFSGSGTTLAVAKRSGRRSVGIEMREEQCEAAAKRLTALLPMTSDSLVAL
jgi:site-specific DNA-methyltransferase (adenine-specific)